MTRGYVEKKLLEIGMPASCKGFGYIVDAVMVLHNPEWPYIKLWHQKIRPVLQMLSTA